MTRDTLKDAIGLAALVVIIYAGFSFGYMTEDGFGVYVPDLGGYHINTGKESE